MIYPGEIYMAEFESLVEHPVIIVSREDLNRGNYALVVLCTSSRFAARSKLATCVPFRAGTFGFTKDCVAQCENMFAVSIANLDLVTGPIGVLDDIALRDVIQAIGKVIGSDCEPE